MTIKSFSCLVLIVSLFSSVLFAGDGVDDLVARVRRTRIKSVEGAEARSELAYLRLRGRIDDSVLTIKEAVRYLLLIIKEHGVASDVGARSCVDLAVIRVRGWIDDSDISRAQVIVYLHEIVSRFGPSTYSGSSARLTLVRLRIDYDVDTGDSKETLIAYMRELMDSLWASGRMDLLPLARQRHEQLEHLGVSDVAARVWADGQIDIMYFPKVSPGGNF